MIEKKQWKFIVVISAVVVLALIGCVASAIHSVDEKMTENCFDDLENAAKSLTREMRDTMATDRTILSAIGEVIVSQNAQSEKEMLDIINSFSTDNSFMNTFQILLPDNRLYNSAGEYTIVSGDMSFNAQASKGEYVSGKEADAFDSENYIIRNAVTVKENGSIVAILYGVISLRELAEMYTTDIYDGNAFVYIVDGTTGDFLLDTWHKSLGNISEMGGRQVVYGHGFDQINSDVANGESGNVGFVSTTIGETLYMHYEPLGINNWSILLTVAESIAFSRAQTITNDLFVMAGLIGAVLLCYMLCITMCLVSAYRTIQKLGSQDQTTQLQNRNAYDAYVSKLEDATMSSICCIFIDANGLHEINNKYGHRVGDQMLRIVANALKEQFDYKNIYRVGGDEFVVLCQNVDKSVCSEKMEKAAKRIEEQDYNVSYGITCRQNELGLSRIIKEADEQMLENKRAFYEAKGVRNTRTFVPST